MSQTTQRTGIAREFLAASRQNEVHDAETCSPGPRWSREAATCPPLLRAARIVGEEAGEDGLLEDPVGQLHGRLAKLVPQRRGQVVQRFHYLNV